MLTDKEAARFLFLHGLKLRKVVMGSGATEYIAWRGSRYPQCSMSDCRFASAVYVVPAEDFTIEALEELVRNFELDSWTQFFDSDVGPGCRPVRWR